jgi:hypothetical protein
LGITYNTIIHTGGNIGVIIFLFTLELYEAKNKKGRVTVGLQTCGGKNVLGGGGGGGKTVEEFATRVGGAPTP